MSSFSSQCPPRAWDALLGDGEHEDNLAWLAVFLTPNAALAEACIVDAYARAVASSDAFVQSLHRWTRSCTIISAIEMQQSRIAVLASIYEHAPADQFDDSPLAPVVLDLLSDSPMELGLCLDILCRAVTVLIGVEHYSPTESAQILGISRAAVEAAYCAALEFLQVVSCRELIDPNMGCEGALLNYA